MNYCIPETLVNEFLKHSNLRSNHGCYTITDTFKDYWDDFLTNNPHLNIRPTVHENVKRILECRTPKLGYALFECPNCENYHIAYHTCKSRFCNSCGVKYVVCMPKIIYLTAPIDISPLQYLVPYGTILDVNVLD